MIMQAGCIRSGALRFCLAMMLGLLLVPGYVVAPSLFAHAGSVAEAGRLAGHIFHIANLGVQILGIAVVMFWLRLESQGWLRWTSLLGLVALVAINEFGIAPVLAAIKQAMGPIDAVPAGDPQRAAFGMWHGISAILHLLASASAVLLVAIGSRSPGGACRPS